MPLKQILEAVLMASSEPVSLERLEQLFEAAERPDRESIRTALHELQQELANRAIELIEVASGWRLQTKKAYMPWITRLWEEKPPRYSRALLETLALIVYKQPITRAEIEDVRGVGVSSAIINTLLTREWIRVTGHRETPGRPILYGTTRTFLDDFGLKTLDALPPLPGISEKQGAYNPVHNFSSCTIPPDPLG